jgi:hypothetical protein
VLEMAESSADKWEYERKIAQRFGFAQQLELARRRAGLFVTI